MATYVNDLRLTELATGEGSGTWGTTTNTNLELIGEALGFGTQNCFASDADATTTVADGSTDPARSMYFKVTSTATLTATRTLTIAPNTLSRVMFIENATTGSQSIAISQGSGANVTIATGKTAVVYLDGAGSGAAVVDAMALVDPGVTDTLAEVLTAGNTTGGTSMVISSGDDVTFTGASANIVFDSSDSALEFADNAKAVFGAGSDLQIYHTPTGNHSIIAESGAGNLILAADNLEINNAANNANAIVATSGGAVTLYHNNSAKLATTSTGIDVTGTAVDVSSTGEVVSTIRSTSTSGTRGAKLRLNVASTGGDDPAGTIEFTYGTGYTVAGSIKMTHTNPAMKFLTGTTERMLIDSSGNVGIGVSPGVALDINRATSTASYARVGNGGNVQAYIGVAGDNLPVLGSFTNHDLRMVVNASEVARFDTSGNFGIGTTSPNEKLVSSGTVRALGATTSNESSTTLSYSSGVGGVEVRGPDTSTRGSLNLYQAASNGSLGQTALHIDSSGQVGIGTSSPASILHAVGSTGITLGAASGDTWQTAAIKPIDEGASYKGTLAFYTHPSAGSAGSPTERMRIDSSGNVKVNEGYLEVNTNTAAAAVVRIDYNSTDSTRRIHALETGGGNARPLQIHAQDVRFRDDTSERMRIDSSGNVGIGASSDLNDQLTVGSSTDAFTAKVSGAVTTMRLGGHASTAAAGRFDYDRSTGFLTYKEGFYDSEGDALLTVTNAGNVGIGSTSPAELVTLDKNSGDTFIRFDKSGTIKGLVGISDSGASGSSSAAAGDIILRSETRVLLDTGGTTRAIVDASGNLLVGTTSVLATTKFSLVSSGNGFAVQAGNGSVGSYMTNTSGTANWQPFSFNNNGTSFSQIGSITCTASATAYNTSSDQRLKENIVDAPSASDDIDAIQVRSFDWKVDGSHQKYGMVAQELVTVAPSAVSQPEDSEEMMSVDYSKLVPMMLKEIQSLRARVAQLEGDN